MLSTITIILITGVLLLILTVLVVFLIRLFMKWSIRMCNSKASMVGKVVVVTGGNTGIGYETAKDIALRGGRVILACRNEKRGVTARDQMIEETRNPNILYKNLNLSSLASVRSFAEDMIKNERKLDVLVNNAGVHGFGDHYTPDGIIEGMQINYFAQFLLTVLLIPLLEKSKGRVVNVSSLCHLRGQINFDRINKIGAYSDTTAYANSKLAMVLFTVELAKRLRNSGVTANSLHPGVVLTQIVDKIPLYLKFSFTVWAWFCNRTAIEGAQTSIYLSVAEEVENVTGKYFVDCKQQFCTWKAKDTMLLKNLWDYSVKLTGYSEVETVVTQVGQL